MSLLSRISPILMMGVLLCVSDASLADTAGTVATGVSQKSYGAQVGEKSLNGITNIGTAWMEIPKNVVKTTQETNILYGMIGGLGAGVFNTLGRLSTGVFDLLSAPIPTDPLVNPVRPWEKFDTSTTYGVNYHVAEPTNQMPTR